MVEKLEFEPFAGSDDKGAAGEEGFAGAREVAEEGEEAAVVGVSCGLIGGQDDDLVAEDGEGRGMGDRGMAESLSGIPLPSFANHSF